MAEGLLRHAAGDKMDVYSAGMVKTGLSPLAVRVMNEKGIDISNQYSKTIEELSDKKFDYVITVCDRVKNICPSLPGKHKLLHWSIDDPGESPGTDEDKLKAFRETRDLSSGLIENLIKRNSF